MLDRPLARLSRNDSPDLLASLLLSFGAGLLITVQAWLLSTVIDRVFLGGQGLGQVSSLLLLLGLVVAARSGIQFGSEVAASRLAVRVKYEVRRALYDHLLVMGPLYTGGERTGELTAVTVEGVEALGPYFQEYLPQLVIAVLVPLSILLLVLPLDPLSALVLLLTAPLIPVFMLLIGNAAEGLTRRQFDLLGRLSAHFLDTLQGLTTLKALNQSQQQVKTIRRVSERYASAALAILRVAFLSALVLEIVATISTAVVAVEVGLRLLYGQMSFQPALMILILAPEFYIPLRMLGLRFHPAASAAGAWKRISEIMETIPGEGRQPEAAEPDAPGTGVQLTTSAESARLPSFEKISLRNVSFAYGDRAAVHEVSFDIRKGETVALFGPSGAGKSTIISLLLRFAEPQSGEILVDGVPLAAIPADEWRERMAWVPQQPHLLHDTIAANIRLARPGASDKEVERAAEAAHLAEFVASLPDGYETVIGERGARLSGGEAQRLAIARAFLKDSPLLLMDEPTSNVDPRTEELLRESTERLMAGRTVLVVAHRINTIYRADRIVVTSAGRVADIGRHEELINKPGLYRDLALGRAPIGN